MTTNLFIILYQDGIYEYQFTNSLYVNPNYEVALNDISRSGIMEEDKKIAILFESYSPLTFSTYRNIIDIVNNLKLPIYEVFDFIKNKMIKDEHINGRVEKIESIEFLRDRKIKKIKTII